MAPDCQSCMLLLLILASLSQVVAENFSCPRDWDLVQNRTCVKFTERLKWYDAKMKCQEDGGSLFDGGNVQTTRSIAAAYLKEKGKETSEWFWVNAAFLEVVDGKVRTFKDMTPMTYFNWRKNKPSNEDEDFIVLLSGDKGEWKSEMDTSNKTSGKRQFGVICQDISAKPVDPAHFFFMVGNKNYAAVTNTKVSAVDAEKICETIDGTLAKITNQMIQNDLTRIVHNKKWGQDFWLAGKRRKMPGVTTSGVYWLNSASRIDDKDLSGVGEGLSVAAHIKDRKDDISLGRFYSRLPKSAICIREPIKVVSLTANLTTSYGTNTTPIIQSINQSTTNNPIPTESNTITLEINSTIYQTLNSTHVDHISQSAAETVSADPSTTADLGSCTSTNRQPTIPYTIDPLTITTPLIQTTAKDDVTTTSSLMSTVNIVTTAMNESKSDSSYSTETNPTSTTHVERPTTMLNVDNVKDENTNLNTEDDSKDSNISMDNSEQGRDKTQMNSGGDKSDLLSWIFSKEMRTEFRKPEVVIGVTVGGAAFILIIFGMILAVVYRKKHVSKPKKHKESRYVEDLEMTDYDTEDNNSEISDYIMKKLANYEPSIPRVDASKIAISNIKGYENYPDSESNFS